MRLLVGTLRTIENEFEECCASIRAQTHTNYEHLVLRDLPVREAHFTLFDTFMRRAGEFDLLVKVDADMVLARNDLFARLVEKFTAEPTLAQYQVLVHDYFTDQLIGGMNVYRNTVRWDLTGTTVFVESGEMIDLRGGRRVVDDSELAPAAIHCKNPGDVQSFHYGAHKGVKVIQALERGWFNRAVEHCLNIEQTWRHFLRREDRRLGLAALAGELALRRRYQAEHLNYANPHLAQVCAGFDGRDARWLRRKVRALRGFDSLLRVPVRLERIDIGWTRFIARRLWPPRWFARFSSAKKPAV